MKGATLVAVILVAGCGGGGGSPDDPDAGGGDDVGPPDSPDAVSVDFVDADGDGLDDAAELAWANAYRPFISVADDDGCPLGGLVVRVFPHPDDPTLITIIYDHLFENDCGFGGHVGDNEVFGATIDPTRPPPAGLKSIKTASHQGTICERVSECGSCPGLTPCDTALVGGIATPVVYSSKDKHGSYATLASCDPFATCFDTCSLATVSDEPPIVNVGEPGTAMVNDLTTQGFITAANGWTETDVFNFDPWSADDFGSAGNIAGDLVDPTFISAACH
jgi:hypothetical protein